MDFQPLEFALPADTSMEDHGGFFAFDDMEDESMCGLDYEAMDATTPRDGIPDSSAKGWTPPPLPSAAFLCDDFGTDQASSPPMDCPLSPLAACVPGNAPQYTVPRISSEEDSGEDGCAQDLPWIECSVVFPTQSDVFPAVVPQWTAAFSGTATGWQAQVSPSVPVPLVPAKRAKRHKASPSSSSGTGIEQRRRDGKIKQRVKPPGLSYPEIVAKLREMPAQQDNRTLGASFLRDELRQLLKKNGVSYHKPGPANLMKTKDEMTSDLLNLLEKGLIK